MTARGSDRVARPARLAALRRAGVLDLSGDSRLERISRLATALLGTPVSLVSLVDDERQVFVAQVGLAEPWASRGGTPLSHSFCQHVVADDAPLVVTDARQDDRVRDNPAITELDVVAYCGVPLRTVDGHTLGSFCVIDDQPRQWTPEEVALVGDLAALAQTELALAVPAHDGRSQVAALAHDMRSMLHGVVGGARTLAHQPVLDTDQREQLLGVVERQAERLEGMLERLMDGAAAQGEVILTAVDVGALLEQLVEEYRLAGAERVHLVAAPTGSHVMADEAALRRCLVNLVDNALTHAGDGSRVEVSAVVAAGRTRIHVTDDGPGIPPEDHDAVFTRGHRASDAGSGRGIGLHTVRRLTRAMGGEVSLASPGATGTTVVVELAAASRRAG